METFFARARGAGPTLLAVLTEGGDVLGGFASQSWHHSLQYYGTGESFLFRCTPDVAVFRWTGDNEFFLLGERNRVAMGGGYVGCQRSDNGVACALPPLTPAPLQRRLWPRPRRGLCNRAI